MAGTDYISKRRLDRFWDKAKRYVDNVVSEAIVPEGSREIRRVLTASTTPPETAEEFDLFINPEMNTLYQWDGEDWNEVDASEEEVYITIDTSHIYTYTDGVFVDSTGTPVDNMLYISDIDEDLDDYTERGLYNVCVLGSRTVPSEYYSFTITKRMGGARGGAVTVITQVLHNNKGYLVRYLRSGSWSEWEEHIYQEEISEIETEDINALF